MREIKFRAWNKITRRMITDHLSWGLELNFGFSNLTSNWIMMQSTGLLDKQGKEVFEGDVLLVQSELILIRTGEKTGKMSSKKYQVVWSDKIAGFCGKDEQGKISAWAMSKDIVEEFHKIIGNIYENPELLEETNVPALVFKGGSHGKRTG